MRDLGVLKERIEYAERHLTASHTARERESQALMKMWQQIRERFELQEQEIARYRTQLSELTVANDELTALIDRLIASVEGRVSESRTETVPEIARLADQMLRSEPEAASYPAADRMSAAPVPGPLSEPEAPPATAPSPDDYTKELEEILELDTPAPEPVTESEPQPSASFSESLKEALADDDHVEDDDISIPSSEPVQEDSASEGIRNLISRIEDAVASPSTETELGGAESREQDVTGDTEDEDLARELDEIESLRNELNGLRNKITAGN